MTRITVFLIFSIAVTLLGCEPILNGSCNFRTYILPVKVYPFQDTFHIGDTIQVLINYPAKYEYEGNNYTVSKDIEIGVDIAHPYDPHVNDGTALKNMKLLADTSIFNIIKYQYQFNDSYALLGEIKKERDKMKLEYGLIVQDTGVISMRFYYNTFGPVPDVYFEGDCYPSGEIFNLEVPSDKDDNWDIFQKHWAWFIEEQSNFTYEQDYKEHAAFTFYVVE